VKSLGPGIITGAADDDPSGIATYSVAGAQLGKKLLWTALLKWPLMAAVQIMCARIGKVTGQGLAGNLLAMAKAPPKSGRSTCGRLCNSNGRSSAEVC
jgi:Mn2+/Fe2+ NRAMP family transporter